MTGRQIKGGVKLIRLAGEDLRRNITYPDMFAGQDERIESESDSKQIG